MRLAGIKDLETANAFLEEKFLPALNAKFNVEARSEADVHRRASGNWAEILNWEEERVVGKDWTIVWNKRWFQIQAEHERPSLVDRKVIVRKQRSGRVELLC